MEKKYAKHQERTPNIVKKTDNSDHLSKMKDKQKPFAINKRVLHDRGDSRKFKNEGAQLKYDATKINKAVEVTAKSIMLSTSGIKATQSKKNNSLLQSGSTDCELDAKLIKGRTKNVEINAEVKTGDNFTIADGKVISLGKRKLEKELPVQTSAGRSDREMKKRTKDDDRNRGKVKEVINIPYMPEDDPQPDAEDISWMAGQTSKLKSGTKTKAVTFKDRSERSPKLTTRESKRPDSKTRWLKGQNSGRKRRRQTNSPPSIKNSINDSLPTEVVKWSPSSVNNHTKPYYEAWVDRSLTAFSKCSEKERLKLEKEIIETLENFKRPVSPELTYERISDEAYTGKIKVRRR